MDTDKEKLTKQILAFREYFKNDPDMTKLYLPTPDEVDKMREDLRKKEETDVKKINDNKNKTKE